MEDFGRATDLRLALQHLKARNFGEAERLCKRILRRGKDDANALQVLAEIATARSKFEDAANYYKKCISLRPKYAEYYARLARVRTMQGRHDEAVVALDRVLKLQADHPTALAWKAQAFERLGEYDKARELIEHLVKASKEDAVTAMVFTMLEQHDGRHREAIAVAQRHIDRPETADHVRLPLWLLIGKSYEKIGEYEKSFDAYCRANSVPPSSFDPEAYIKTVDTYIETFSSECLSSLPRSRYDSQRPIFVIGMPRSGTTLLEQIIDCHPLVQGAGEFPAMARLVTSLPSLIETDLPYPQCVADLTQQTVDRLSKSYLDDLAKGRRSATRVVDKSLANYLYLGLISKLLPKARVIHCRRDPLDTCFSCFASPLSPVNHSYALNLRHLGLVYRQYERLMRHWQQVLDLEMMEVWYEDLIADQEGVSRAMIEFCGLQWHEKCLRFYESKRDVSSASYAQVRQPIYRSSVGRAEKFEAFLGPLKRALAGGAEEGGAEQS